MVALYESSRAFELFDLASRVLFSKRIYAGFTYSPLHIIARYSLARSRLGSLRQSPRSFFANAEAFCKEKQLRKSVLCVCSVVRKIPVTFELTST